MTITREDLNPCTVKLEVVPTDEQIKQSFDKAFKQLAKKVKLPGFRPGMAPKAMVSSLIPKDDLYEEAAQNLIRTTIPLAIKDQELEPDQTTRPSVELHEISDEDGFKARYTVKVPLPPKVELAGYDGLTAATEAIAVSEDEIEQQINEFRSRRGERSAVTDRGVAEGDIAVVSIKAEGEDPRNFMVIAGKSFPSLDEALTGMKVEELKSVDLEFPENFQDKDWAGTSAHVTVTLNSLTGVKLPELDDEFAKAMETESVEDLRERVRRGIYGAKEMMQFEIATDKLINDLLEKSEVHVSDNMWEALADRRLRETAEEQAKERKSLEQYAKEQGMTIEEFIKAWQERAKFEVQRALIIQQVFAKEQMQLTNDDLNRELVIMAGEYNMKPAEMVKTLQENKALDELQFRSIQRRVRSFLLTKATSEVIEGAVVEEAVADAAPKPKAKSKAKAKAEAEPEATAEA
jgi:trigger factor